MFVYLGTQSAKDAGQLDPGRKLSKGVSDSNHSATEKGRVIWIRQFRPRKAPHHAGTKLGRLYKRRLA